jgi:predicted ATPase with chaperone activity
MLMIFDSDTGRVYPDELIEPNCQEWLGASPATTTCGRQRFASRSCLLEEARQRLMRTAMKQLNVPAHAYRRVPRLARTIGELAGKIQIQLAHSVEALPYRPKLMVS